MNKQNAAKLHKMVQAAALKIDGKLPDHPAHPYGRIPIAHIYDVIRRVMTVPCKQCGDDRFDDIVTIIEFCGNNPDEPHCASALRATIKPEQVYVPPTLEDWI